jgi:flagellar biogenesis protein FliO
MRCRPIKLSAFRLHVIPAAIIRMIVVDAACGQSTLYIAAPNGKAAETIECTDGQCASPLAPSIAVAPPAPILPYRRANTTAAARAVSEQANPLRPSPESTVAEAPADIGPAAVSPPDAPTHGTQPQSMPLYGTPPTFGDQPPRIDARLQAAAFYDQEAIDETATPELELPPAQAPLPAFTEALDAPTPTDPHAESDLDSRQLAPRSTEHARGPASAGVSRDRSFFAPALSKLESLSTAGAGLAIVVGLFLLCMWLLRRSVAKPSGALPPEAFAVLGRAPLTSQSFAQLLRVGNKLVLVAMSGDAAQPLTEVTDPAEVDRIAGLCLSAGSKGSSAEFQQVLAQLSREPARGFLGREGSAGRRRT